MLKNFVLLLFCLPLINAAAAQKVLVNVFMENKKANDYDDTIFYDTSRKLTWEDFQGVPEEHHPGGAITASGFAFNSSIKMTNNLIRINIGVYTFFSKSSSWRKQNINSRYHLLHEQHHFDITRLGAEEFAREIARSTFTKNNYEKVLTAEFNKAYQHSVDLQKQYDLETNHSINQQAQFRWNDKIAAEIKKLSL